MSILTILQRFRQYPFDFVALGLIVIFTPVIYIYAIFYLLPDAFDESNLLTQVIAYASATWCLIGVLANLYQVRIRRSSIHGRFLPQPILAASGIDSSTPLAHLDGIHRRTQHLNLTLGQQFMAKPFGSDDAWHICSKCEVYVPSRCWHCSKGCNTCILRRDHHCVFAMTCIGEENHSNFLGLVLYLGIGTAYACVMLMLYSSKNFDTSYGWFFLRAFLPLIFIWTSHSFLYYFICTLCLLGSICAVGVFVAYLLMASKGQTSADRKYSTTNLSFRGASYKKLERFLGPNPFLRIIWPFHPLYRTDYGSRHQN